MISCHSEKHIRKQTYKKTCNALWKLATQCLISNFTITLTDLQLKTTFLEK